MATRVQYRLTHAQCSGLAMGPDTLQGVLMATHHHPAHTPCLGDLPAPASDPIKDGDSYLVCTIFVLQLGVVALGPSLTAPGTHSVPFNRGPQNLLGLGDQVALSRLKLSSSVCGAGCQPWMEGHEDHIQGQGGGRGVRPGLQHKTPGVPARSAV